MKQTSQIINQKSLKLFFQTWQPDGQAKGAILLVHGMGEHSGRYLHVGEYLTKKGFAVFTCDLRGHGKSGGQRGHITPKDYYLSEIDILFSQADQQFPRLPRFLYGHSLGGLLVLNYTLRRKPEVAGVIVTGAGLRTALEKQTVKIIAARIFSKLLPAMSMPSGLDATSISRDEQVVRAYQSDPLVHDRATPAFAITSLSTIHYIFSHAAEFPCPLLVMHGGADKLTYPRGSQELAETVGDKCTLKIWDGLYHELHNEPEKLEVLEYTVDWITQHL